MSRKDEIDTVRREIKNKSGLLEEFNKIEVRTIMFPKKKRIPRVS